MDRTDRRRVAAAARERAIRLREAALTTHGPAPVLDPVETEPFDHHADDFPESVAEQCERLGGIASAVVVEDARVLLVYNHYADRWEPPGGAHDAGETLATTARRETDEEANLGVELTGVLYTRDMAFDYGHDELVRIPVVVFTARRVAGRRAVPWHYLPTGDPEITDADWFGPNDLPAGLRDRERIRTLLADGD